MKFVTFRRGDRVSAGLLLDGDRVLDLAEVPGLKAKTALDVVLAGAEPGERPQLAGALERLHQLLVTDSGGELRTLPSERT